MAEIDVARWGPTLWPGIIGLVALALVIWGLAELLGGGEVEGAPDETPAGVLQGRIA